MSTVTCFFRRTCVILIALVGPVGALLAQTAPPKPPATPAAPGQPAKPGAPAAPAAPAEPTGPLNLEAETEALYSDAVTNFNVGKYDVALQKIGAIKSKVTKDFEKVMFLEGACYYNMANYDKAAETLEQFVTKFPTSPVLIDAKINLGRSLLKKGDTDKGIKYLKEVATTSPQRKGEVGIELAEYYKAKGDLDEALNILGIVTENAGTSPEVVRGVLMMAEIYAGKGDADKANASLAKLRNGSAADDTIVQINSLGLKVGDEMREAKRYGEALIAYQTVHSRDEILRVQKNRIERIQEWIKDVSATPPKRVRFLGREIGKDDLTAMLKANQEIQEELEKNKDYDASLYFRLGQCFYEMGRYYESLLAFSQVYEKFPEYKDREFALFGMIVCNQALERPGKAYAYCDKYLSAYPDGSKITAVTEMLGVLAYQSGNIDKAIDAFRRSIDKTKDKDSKERLTFLLGVTLFEAQRFDDARVAFQTLLKDFKGTAFGDDAEYRVALTYFFQNDSKNTRKAFRDYIAHFAKGGQYIVDAKYRLAFIEYQAGDVEPALAELEELMKESPVDPAIGQVHLLRGDIYSKRGKEGDSDKALAAYLEAVDKAKTPDVLDIAMDSATQLLQADGKWDKLVSIWQTYYTTHKDGPTAMKAIYWISMGMKRSGKIEDAQKFIAEQMRPALSDPKNDQVEMLLQQEVFLIVPKKRAKVAASKSSKTGAAAPAPAPAPTPPPADGAAKPADGTPADPAKPGEPAPAATAEAKPAAPAVPPVTLEELDEKLRKLLAPDGEASLGSGAAQARILYARALLARYMRDVNKYESLISVIPDAAKPEELSPLLLATLGDMLRKKGDVEKAEAYYNRLREAFATSDYGDKAPVGLGEIAYDKKEYDKALLLFNEAIEKYEGSSSMLDATLGKAKCLLALNKLELADKLYNTILYTKDWRSAAPIALYNLGQIYEKKREWGKAITYYTRVILAHQKYKDWLAKSYLQGAKCWINDGKADEARKMLNEMLRRTDIQDQPEFNEARAELDKLASK